MSKLQGLKKQLIQTVSVCTVVIAIFGGITYFSISHADGLIEDLNKINSETKKIISDKSTAERDFKGLTEAANIYNNIPEIRRPSKKGFSSPQERIRAIVPTINSIKERYQLSTLEYTFNGRPKIDDDIPLKYAEGYTNDLSFTFSGLNDELALAAISALINEMPGYMMLSTLSIESKEPYSQELLKRLEAGELSIEVVTGKADFSWKTLKALEKPREIKKQSRRR
jgi:hypothetical protein